MFKKFKLGLVLGLACLSSAQADSLFGEFQRLPTVLERGFSIGADFGLLYMTGTDPNTDGKTVLNPGFQMSFPFGMDIQKYISIYLTPTLGISQADINDRILTGGVNFFFFDASVRGQYPLGRWYPFVEVGGGIVYSRPGFEAPGKASTQKIDILLAGGIEYYTLLRHYSLYAKATYHKTGLPLDGLTAAFGLKYTF